MYLLFRIDRERYLTHAIDHFTRDELAHFQYAIISAGIKNQGKCENIVKISILFPSMDIQRAFIDYQDKSIIKKMYFKELDETKNEMYGLFVNPILQHQDILIICTESENVYIDILLEYLKKNFELDCIDLNELFTKGRVGSVYIDRDAIHNKAVDVRRTVGKIQIEALESTSDGRLKLLNLMGVKDKMKKLKDLGIMVNKSDIKDLDKLLIEGWVEDD